jgi:hypothetical protein
VRPADRSALAQPPPLTCFVLALSHGAGPLFAWFTEKGYTFIPHFYGNPNNNYMGVRRLLPARRACFRAANKPLILVP